MLDAAARLLRVEHGTAKRLVYILKNAADRRVSTPVSPRTSAHALKLTTPRRRTARDHVPGHGFIDGIPTNCATNVVVGRAKISSDAAAWHGGRIHAS